MGILCTLSETQYKLLGELINRGSLRSISKCVKNIEYLEDFQTLAIAYSIITKSCLLNIDTGLGKTLIASGIINILRAMKPNLKWVYLCQCSNLKTTADKLERHLFSSNIVYCDSTEKRIVDTFYSRKAINADVIVLSYESITQPEVEGFLFKNRDLFQGIILDESQMLSNLASHTSRLISSIINSSAYRILLSATPLRINVEQVVNQIYMLDREMFSQVNMKSYLNQYKIWSDGVAVGYKNLDQLQMELMPRMLSFSRTDLQMRGDYNPIMHICTSGLDKDAQIDDVIDYKNYAFGNTAIKLLDILSEYKKQGKRGLIYANRNTMKKALRELLEKEGYSCAIMDGSNTVTQKAKDTVHQAFLAGEYDVLITNITTGKDLPCDFIIFYELTFDYKQMIGRGERGLSGVGLDVHFIITDTTYEMRFFYVNVYQRGILLEKLCAKDLPELHGAMKQLEKELSRRGVTIYDLLNE